jgi:threonine dehydratase
VDDGEIAGAVLLLLERAKQLVEADGAASVAALLSEESASPPTSGMRKQDAARVPRWGV